mgnify:CR=1 FL=1
MATDILVKIGADISDFSRKMADSNRALENFSKANKQTFDSFKQVGTAVTGAGVAIAGGLGVAAKHAIDFESSFAGVRKTVDASEAEFAVLEKGIRDMSKELPASVHEINGVAEAAGQLGIKKENILDFTRTMIDLGESTNLSSEEAATSFARFANIVGMSQDDFGRLGSSVVELGNNLATTEAEIVEMGMRLAGQGAQIGLTEAQIMALAASMSSVGIEAEAGGTAMTMVMKKMQNAVSAGGKDLEGFAKAAGMSSKEFADAFKNDPITAIDAFIKGLAESGEEGKNLNDILSEVGITGIREADAVLRLAGASDVLSGAVDMSTKAWDENTALSDEAAQRYETMASKLAILKNTLIDAGISIGHALIPAIGKVTEFIQNLVEKFNGLSEGTKQFIAISAAVVSALMLIVGPILLLIGFMPQLIAGFTAVTTVISSLGAAFTFITGPIGITIAAIVGIVAALVLAYNKVEWFREMVDTAWARIKEVFFTAIDWIKNNVVVPIMTEIAEFINEILGKIRQFWDKYGGLIMENAKLHFDNIMQYIKMVMGIIKGIFEVVWPIISGVVKIAWGLIKTVVRTGIDIVMGIIDTVMAIIKGDWESAWESIKKTVEKIWDNIKKFFEEVDLVQVGRDIIQGLINGIGSMATAVWDAAKKIASNVKDSIMSFLGIHSPARELITIGKYTGEGFAIGISNMVGAVRKASDKLADAAIVEPKQISMDYATPSGTYASLSSAVNGTVDVNARDDMIAAAIDNLSRKLENMRIEMDRREMGRFVSDVTTEDRNSAVRGRGHRRING